MEMKGRGRQVQLIQRSAYMYKWNVVQLNFNFHKVVRQQNSGAVEDFILPYWNRSTFAKVIVKITVARYFMVHGVVHKTLLYCKGLI